jgi:hypothetical protein
VILYRDPRPTLQLVIVHRQTAFARREDEHPGADQLIADMSGWAGAESGDITQSGTERIEPATLVIGALVVLALPTEVVSECG